MHMDGINRTEQILYPHHPSKQQQSDKPAYLDLLGGGRRGSLACLLLVITTVVIIVIVIVIVIGRHKTSTQANNVDLDASIIGATKDGAQRSVRHCQL